MSKKSKIILIAAAIILITAVLSVVQYFVNQDTGTGTVRKTYYTYLSEIVNSRWEAQSEWNKTLYDSLAREIYEAGRSNNIKSKQQKELFVLDNSLALNVISSFFDTEMQAPESRRAEVNKNYQGVKYLEESRYVEHSKEFSKSLRELKGMYSDYTKTMDFAARSFECTAEVNSDFKWKPYGEYRNLFYSTKQTLSSGRCFNSHFSNINLVKNAWRTFSERLNKAEKHYYEEVDRQLKSKISSLCNVGSQVERTESSFRRVSSSYNDYMRDSRSGYATESDLVQLKTRMADAKSELDSLSEMLKRIMETLTETQGRFVEETNDIESNFACNRDFFLAKLRSINGYSKSVNNWLEDLAAKQANLE